MTEISFNCGVGDERVGIFGFENVGLRGNGRI